MFLRAEKSCCKYCKQPFFKVIRLNQCCACLSLWDSGPCEGWGGCSIITCDFDRKGRQCGLVVSRPTPVLPASHIKPVYFTGLLFVSCMLLYCITNWVELAVCNLRKIQNKVRALFLYTQFTVACGHWESYTVSHLDESLIVYLLSFF